MPTTVVKTIGSGGDYATVQAWNNAAPANLVTADQIWEGQLLAGTNLNSSSGTLLTVSGSTTDATRYKHLTAASGASFVDNASVQTNALRYNTANGASLSVSYDFVSAIVVQEANFHISRLQIASTSGSSRAILTDASAGGLVIDKCIIEAPYGHTIDLSGGSKTVTISNSLIVQRKTAADRIIYVEGALVTHGVTLAVPSDLTAATAGIEIQFGSLTATNTAIYGATTAISVTAGSTSITATNCATNQSSPPTGFSTVAYNTTTGSGFENITDATRDYRIKSTSALKDAGATDGSYATDIANSSRPQGSSYDIGAWEFVTSGGGGASGNFLTMGCG